MYVCTIFRLLTGDLGVVHTTNAFLPLLRAGRAKKVVALSTGLADVELTLASGFAVIIDLEGRAEHGGVPRRGLCVSRGQPGAGEYEAEPAYMGCSFDFILS
ncbi:hypothetical protein A0H81_06954 [Grifola frondosa]|uniref:Uncharacterized protein n=1 Tax=Grifola frondosa TaxID=5627 RepID=A0A1C7M8G1_GRIFR|nr:hypothetical protein A0H81_06954 [Grifola frondosa]